jgi:hypothetical protein
MISMKILIVSDNHGDYKSLEKVVLMHPEMDLYLNAGDSLLEPEQLRPFITVKGNCDFNQSLMEKIRIPTPYGRLIMQHYPWFSDNDIKNDENMIFVYGHTHRHEFKKDNLGRYYVNPGSITRPRDSFGKCYCILTIKEKEVKCDFFNL